MYQRANDYLGNYMRRFGVHGDSVVCEGRCGQGRLPCCCHRQKSRRVGYLTGLLLITLTAHPILAQEQSSGSRKSIDADIAAMPRAQQQTPAPGKRPITISDAVSIFLQQNLQLVAARYDIDTVDAEKLTARLRPNPQVTFGSSGLPVNFTGPFVSQQTFSYGISQTFELGGKRSKRIGAANANSDVAKAQFQMVLWQLTNDLKRKFYAVVLAQSLPRKPEDFCRNHQAHGRAGPGWRDFRPRPYAARGRKTQVRYGRSQFGKGLRGCRARLASHVGWRLSSYGHRRRRHT